MLECRPDAFFTLLGRTQASRLGLPFGKARVGLGLCLERLHQLAGFFEVFVQAGLAAKGSCTGICSHAHAVLRHAHQADRACCGQGGHVVAEQLVHQGFIARTKVVEGVVVDRYTPANPPVGIVLLAQPGQFASAAHALQRGVQPQCEQNVRVDRRTSGRAATRFDGLDQPAQILVHDVAPHQTGSVVLGQQGFQIRGSQLNLRTVGPQQSGGSLALFDGLLGLRLLYLLGTWLRQVFE